MKQTMKAKLNYSLVVAAILATTLPVLGQRLNPPPPLNDELTSRQIGEGTRNLVICVHGWDNPPNPARDRYTETEWAALVVELKQALPRTGTDPWELLLYHWEDDAATGFWSWNDPLNLALPQATQAAINAGAHGESLGPRLPQSLRRVHFITHSAGAWCARRAAEYLTQYRPFVVVQVTLLDPFVPEDVAPSAGLFSRENMSEMANWVRSDRISQLENYFADDLIFNVLDVHYPTLGTQPIFSWGSKGINQQVDNGFTGIPGVHNYYDFHSGPLLFYADGINAVRNPSFPPPGLIGISPPYTQLGWYRSLYYRTLQGQLPKITTQPVGQNSTGSSVTLSVTASGTGPFGYQWYKNNALIIGANNASYTINTSTDPPTPYVVGVTDANGERIFSDRAVVGFYSPPTPTAPSIASVAPSTLPTSPLKQPFKIYGAGFTGTSTLLFNGSIASDPARLTVVNANAIDYDIIVASAGSWNVKVINGAQQSNLGYFSVVNPPPNTGSLTVNLSPEGAVSAGAQWRVDGSAYRNNGDTATGLAPGSHTVSFKSVSGYTTPADKSVSITSGANTPDSGAYTVITPSTYTLTINQGGVMGYIVNQPFGSGSGNIYNAGAVVQLTANANYGYHFVSWGGDVSGTANPTTITMNGNKTVSANFAAGDPNLGTLTVTIQPAEAAAAGVKWGWNENDYRDSGSSVLTFPGSYILTIHGVDGWIGSPVLYVTVTAGQTANYTATFTQDTTPGLLTVTLSPPSAVTAGAHWRVNGGGAQGNGATVSLPPGTNYSVTFDSVPGWTAPPSQTVTVQRAQTKIVAGNYTPPVGQPVIAAVHPSFGTLAGGTTLTIEGVNFTAPASVFIGGKLASNITVSSSSQIVCLTPSNSVYGTVPVLVQTATGSATNANGFTYGVERGNGIELVTAIGGRAFGLAVQGNYACVGEGSSLLVMNISNPANPALFGRLPLPGKVMDIALFGQYAYVADADAGLQVVDISNPAAPVLKGYYLTPGWANGIVILGGRVYLADGAGLEILDLANPILPALLSSTNFNGNADDVALVVKPSGVFAYLSSGGTLAIVDVSQPLSPNLRGSTSIGSWTPSLAVSGDYVFAAASFGGMKTLDVSNPDAPVNLGDTPVNLPGISGIVTALSVSATNGLIYAAGSSHFFIVSHSGNVRTPLGWKSIENYGYNSVISGNRVYMAAGAAGFEVVDVSNSSNPSLLAKFTDSNLFGDYGAMALSGNYLFTMGYNGFRVFDVSTPALPMQLWQNAGLNASFGQIVLKNNYAFVVPGNYPAGVSLIDVNIPTSPTISPNYIPQSTVYGNKMATSGNNLLVAGMDNSTIGELVAFDISSPSSPVQRGSLSFTPQSGYDPAVSVATAGGKAVVGMNSSALKVIDISNINSLVERGQITNIGFPRDVTLTADGHYAYVIDGNANSRIRIIDVSNSLSPSVVTNFPLGAASGERLTLQGNLLYAVTFQGLFIFDVTIPTSPILTRSYPFGGATGVAFDPSVFAQRDMLYLASLDGGFAVLNSKDIEIPTIFITNPTFSAFETNTTGTLNLGGSAGDNNSVVRVTWLNDRGGSGDAAGTANWSFNGIVLQPGTNILTATAFDQAGNSGSDTLTVIYQTPKQSQTITFPSLTNRTFGDAPITIAAAASSGLLVNFSILSGPATLSNNVLTITGAGTIAVRASQSGNDSFSAAPDATNSFNVAKSDQAITFGLLPDKTVGDPPFAVTATASSGLLVAFSIVSGPATASNNVVTLTGAGVVTVRASQSGNTNFNAALDVERSFVVAKLPQFITFGALSRQVFGDAPFALSASASSGLPVNFSVLSGPAVVSGNILTMTGAGMVVLRASRSGDATYAPAPNADQLLIVVPGKNVITDFQRLASGMFTFHFYGEPGTNYVVQGSTNLVNWLSLATNQVNGLGYLEFNDASATNYGKRFYRIAPLSALSSGGPVIGLQLVGDKIVVSWPTNWLGFSLESATSLPAASWTSNSASPAILNGQFTVTNAIIGGEKFYRLKK